MINGQKFGETKRRYTSLRVRFVAVFILAISLAVATFFLAKAISKYIIDDVYLSQENKAKREEQYHKSLQDYIYQQGISFDDIDRVSEWQMKNQYVYLMIYKEKTDEQALFIPDEMVTTPPVDNTEKTPTEETPELPEDDASKTPNEDDPTLGEDGENDEGGTDENEPAGGEKNDTGTDENDNPVGGNNSGGGNSSGGNVGGITVKIPTKSELKLEAEKLEMLFIELPENQYVYAKFAEYTEYLYYDIANISSVALGGLVMLVLLLVYISMLTARIRRLGVAVNRVAIGETEREITVVGNDEIARLAGNVERMRSSIVENYKREKDALESNTELITSMSHDIRTPLTVLLGYMDVMHSEMEGNPKMQEYIKAAENTAMRLKKLSDDMFAYFLVFGKSEEEFVLEEYDAETLLMQVISEHILLMKESGYTVEVSSDDVGIRGKILKVDAPSLVRIFDNVFSNMYKYADKLSPIKISITTTPCEILVAFENKTRADNETVESNGIGMKTCRKLAEYMDIGFSVKHGEDNFIVKIALRSFPGERIG